MNILFIDKNMNEGSGCRQSTYNVADESRYRQNSQKVVYILKLIKVKR